VAGAITLLLCHSLIKGVVMKSLDKVLKSLVKQGKGVKIKSVSSGKKLAMPRN
jgi:hypothetical protein